MNLPLSPPPSPSASGPYRNLYCNLYVITYCLYVTVESNSVFILGRVVGMKRFDFMFSLLTGKQG